MDSAKANKSHLKYISAYRSDPLYYTHVIEFAPADYSLGFHTHDRAEVILVKSGSLSAIVDDQVYKLKKNSLIIIRPNTPHKMQFNDNSAYERYDLQFNESILANQVFRRLPLHLCCVNCNGNRTILDLFEKLDFYHKHFKGEDFRLLVKNTVEELLFRLYIAPPDDFGSEPFSIHPILKQAIQYINLHYHEPISVEDVSHHLSVTKSHLHHLFAEFMQITPKKYINLQRLALAQQLIQAGEKPTAIFSTCGFCDYATFFRNYTRHFGCTPSQELPPPRAWTSAFNG